MTETQSTHPVDRLRRSNDDLYQFAYLAAHEMQEPLRAISGFLTLIEQRYARELPREANEWLQEAIEGSERMGRLIRSLLTLSRVESQDIAFTEVELADCLSKAKLNLQVLIDERNAQVQVGPLPKVAAEPDLMILLFQNLISNAIKFCDRKPVIRIDATRQDGRWMISVRDNGIGFDMNYSNRLFQRFERLHSKAKYPGSGLGLALCKRIVERHAGEIWAESDGRTGSVFYVALPASTIEGLQARSEH